ncbi:hypothetical protein AMTRI_Chr05g70560 [Amborella trichopoda]
MASSDSTNMELSPKSNNAGVSSSLTTSASGGGGSTSATSSPKGVGMCLCSPTKHEGSFRCRLHRTLSSTWMRRSNCMPANKSPQPENH